jgi:hypothetical protein
LCEELVTLRGQLSEVKEELDQVRLEKGGRDLVAMGAVNEKDQKGEKGKKDSMERPNFPHFGSFGTMW